MNENLPPIDPTVREQLSLRSAGRIPEGLLADVLAALDGDRGGGAMANRPRISWSVPRLAGAAIAMAFVAVFVAAIVAPGWHGGPVGDGASPAGYPADRALSTAELAAVMAGPTLQTNTTLVADVRIDVRSDVCPMDRYPTLGVIEGMDSQVCVMVATVADLNSNTALSGGPFAFRYLGPGYLGLLAAIVPASESRLAFRVTDDWPIIGEPFAVEGWLGADGLLRDCLSAPTAGDVLNPNGLDCSYDDWLGDSSAAPGIAADHVTNPSSPYPSYDPLSLRGNARHVEAGGMRLIDSIDPAAPVFGVYIVRANIADCVVDTRVSGRGCGTWRVLARVADITVPGPVASISTPPTPTALAPETPIPAPTTTPAGEPLPSSEPVGYIGPASRPLTSDEVARIFATEKVGSVRYVIDERAVCDGTDCTRVAPKPVADLFQSINFGDSWILVGPVDVRPDGSLVWTVPQALSNYQDRFIFIVDATMFGQGLSTWLDSDASAELTVQDGAFSRFAPAGTPANSSVHGLFLVQRVDTGKTCGVATSAPSGPCVPQVEILARLVTTAVP